MSTTLAGPTPRPRLAGLFAALAEGDGSDAAPGRENLYQRLAAQLVDNFDLDGLLANVVDQVALQARAERAFVGLFDAGGAIVHSVVWGEAKAGTELFPHSRNVIERLLTLRATVWVPDVSQDPLLATSHSVVELSIRHVIALPLKIGDQVVGVIYLDGRRANRDLTRQDMALLESMAAYATLAISNVRMHNEMSARAGKLQMINEVSLAISATLKLDHLLALILDHSLSLCGGEQGYVLLGDGEELSCLASLDAGGEPVKQLEISRSIVQRCLQENASVCILDTHEDLEAQTKSVMALDLRSIMCIPLVENQRRMGALYISSRAITKTFTSQDQSLLEAIANQAALAIRNAQLLKEQEQQISELERALQMVREAQLKAVTDGLTGLYNHVYFKEQLYNSVLEAQRYGQQLSVIMVDLDHFKRVNDTYGHQAGDHVLRAISVALRKVVRDCDILARYGGEEFAVLLPQTDQSGATVVAERIREALAAEVLHTEGGTEIRPTASLGVAAYRTGSTTTELLERADKALYLAKHGGRNRVCVDGQDVPVQEGAIQELKEQRENLADAFINTVEALAAAVDAKDRYTAAHSHHVEALARRVGEAMGLPERELREVEMAAVLHDVGKIGIPDAILQKPAPLDDAEWEIMRTHPVLGAKILAAGNLPGLARAIRHHHEFWDGNGYPDGLRGEAIPAASRIVAVIDAYGAMTTDRVYRKSLGKVRAVEELRKYAGTQFDPHVVDAFLQLIGEEAPPSP